MFNNTLRICVNAQKTNKHRFAYAKVSPTKPSPILQHNWLLGAENN